MILLKKVFAILIVALLVFGLFGCKTDEKVSASKAPDQISESAVEIEKAEEVAKLEAEQAAKEAAEKAAAEEVAKNESEKQQPTMTTNGDFFITINLSTNKLTLYSGSDVVAVYSVATGKLENGVSLTPSGKFTILTKVRDPAWGGGGYTDPVAGGAPNNPLGHYWMGLSAGSHPGNEYGIHGNIDEGSIGTYASHGCIRMHNNEVPILFDTVPKGTSVWIGYANQLAGWGVENFQ